jgi:peptide-methionine (S)-S-oxide reductase
MPGIVATAVGYMGGTSAFPDEALAYRTGHAETVLVEFDPRRTPYAKLLEEFWKLRTAAEPENPAAQKSPYRAEIWTYSDDELTQANASKLALERAEHHKLRAKIQAAKPFYLAEDFHQQYDEKSGTEACPIAP